MERGIEARDLQQVRYRGAYRADGCQVVRLMQRSIENAAGSSFDDVLLGNALDNRLEGRLGNDWLDGGAGVDTAVFSGARSDYFITTSYGKVYVAARDGISGYDTLLNIEKLAFGATTLNLTTSALGSDVDISLDQGSITSGSLPDPSDEAPG